MLGVPGFHNLNWCSVVKRFPADVWIVQPDIAIERCLKVLVAKEMVTCDDLGRSSIEPTTML